MVVEETKVEEIPQRNPDMTVDSFVTDKSMTDVLPDEPEENNKELERMTTIVEDDAESRHTEFVP